MKRVNVFRVEAEYDSANPEGYGAGAARLGPVLGASLLGGTVYELPAGTSIWPYHYEYADEEWLLVLDGAVVVRHPGGEDELERGDLACFPVGPDGAHKVTNRGQETVRVLMLSPCPAVSVTVYPDSDKIGVYPGNDRDRILVRRESAVDYWDREVP